MTKEDAEDLLSLASMIHRHLAAPSFAPVDPELQVPRGGHFLVKDADDLHPGLLPPEIDHVTADVV